MARIKMVKASGGRAQGKTEGASYDEYVAAVAASLVSRALHPTLMMPPN